MARILRGGLVAGLAMAVAGESAASAANPIRRVVSMLQMMQEKVTAEGKKEKELFDKFMCYCSTGAKDLAASISAAEAKSEQDTADLKAAEAALDQLEKDLKQHEADRADAKAALAEATALREKEAKVYAKESSEHKTNLAALGKAIAALEKGMTGFLQTAAGVRLRQLTIDMDLSAADRDIMSAFLAAGTSQGYAPQSGQIVGILKQMKDTMEKDLADITAAEEEAIKNFEELSAAKTKEIEANGAAIEAKTERKGKTGLEIVELKESLDDGAKAMADDKKFLEDLDKNCETKKKEWEVRSATRAEELLALADTIKLLNDDDALELFKKTLPSPSLLQVQVSEEAVRQRALSVLKASQKNRDPRMDLVMLALTGRKGTFDKVLTMIDDMVTLLGKEQADDDAKKEYCEKSLDKAEDEKKVLEQTIADLEKSIADAKETIATLTQEIAALVDGIAKLDKSVAEATETRKAENEEYKSTMAANKAAKELIGVAKNRMNKFYSPKLYKAPPKRELSAEDRIFVNNGGTPPPTEAPGGIAGTGITYLQQPAPVFAQVSAHTARSDDIAAPPPPPETWDTYAKKGQESNGVMAMMDLLIADLDKEIQEMEVEEKDSQAEYESFMEDSKTKRAQDSKSIADKEGYKADMESELQKSEAEHKSTVKEDMDKAEEIKDLHLECDWLMSNFEARKEARAGEVESLKKAKAVLSGADFSLAQTSSAVRSMRLRGASPP